MKQRPIDLHIEELVLHGLSYDRRHRVRAAVELELERLLGERGLPPSLAGDEASLDVAAVEVRAGRSAEATGREVARSVFQQLGNPSSGNPASGEPR
jgi:hypothetical protein